MEGITADDFFAISQKGCKFAHRKAIGHLEFFQGNYWLLIEEVEGEYRGLSSCPRTSVPQRSLV